MEYSADEFSALCGEVERQSGALLPEECKGELITYKIGGSASKVYTCQCNNKSMFVSVYEPTKFAEKKGALDNGGGFVRACAVCDSMGSWPRYKEAIDEVENM